MNVEEQAIWFPAVTSLQKMLTDLAAETRPTIARFSLEAAKTDRIELFSKIQKC